MSKTKSDKIIYTPLIQKLKQYLKESYIRSEIFFNIYQKNDAIRGFLDLKHFKFIQNEHVFIHVIHLYF